MKDKILIKEIEKILNTKYKIKKKINYKTDITKFKNWDSLKHLDFIMNLERLFKCKFSIKENFNLKKIKDFIEVLKKNKI